VSLCGELKRRCSSLTRRDGGVFESCEAGWSREDAPSWAYMKGWKGNSGVQTRGKSEVEPH